MPDSTKSAHVQGLYTVIVALIALIGGYLLKEPIQNTFFKKYSQIGGVWKPHGDLMYHCNVATVKDTFYLRMEGSYSLNRSWIVQTMGISKDGISGDFNGKMFVDDKQFPITGHLELAGSDQLGVTVYFNKEKSDYKNYAFVRETLEATEIQKKEE